MFSDKFSLFFFSLFKPQEKHYILLCRLKTRPIVYTSKGIYDLIKELQKLEKVRRFVCMLFSWHFLSDSNTIRTQNHLVHKWTLKHLVCKQTHNHLVCKGTLSLNGWVFVYELSGCRFKSCCSQMIRLHSCLSLLWFWMSEDRAAIHIQSFQAFLKHFISKLIWSKQPAAWLKYTCPSWHWWKIFLKKSCFLVFLDFFEF